LIAKPGPLLREARVGCGVVVLRDGKLLLLKRVNPPEADHWGLPGGKVDWLEPAAVSAARELLEETGVTAGPMALLCAADYIDEAAGEHWLCPIYLALEATGEAHRAEPHKHSDLGWFDPANSPSPLTVTAQAAIEALSA
jgi:ADP-ribose pyrophosphatase YjhB (NUDIX family)